MFYRICFVFVVVSLVVMATCTAAAQGVTPSFTYQGKLANSSGTPVNGTADLRFTLWDAATGGSQAGSLVQANDVSVEGGQFTIPLDYGASAFTGAARWLEIEVRTPAGSGSYTLLSPRQQIVSVPYALYAQSSGAANADTVDGFHASTTPTANTILPLNVSGKLPNSVLYTGAGNGLDADLLDGQHGSFYQNASNLNVGTLADARLSANVALLNNTQTFSGAKTFSNASNSFTGIGSGLISLNASNLTSGAMPDARLSGTYSQALTLSNVSNSFTGNGAGLTNLNAASLTGSIADTRLSSNVALLSSTQTFTGDKYFSGKVGIGTASTSHPLTVENAADAHFTRAVYGVSSSTGAVGQHRYGVYGETRSTDTSSSGGGVMGWSTSATGSTAGVRGESASVSGTGVFGFATSSTGTNYGVKAVSNSPTGWAGHFTGRGYFSGNVGIKTASPVNSLSVVGNADFSGNVGIGTNSPVSRLHVAGNAKVDGNLSVTGDLQVDGRAKLPIAYGMIRYDGIVLAGTSNVSSTWNSTYLRYEITIAGENLQNWWYYITTVTPQATVPVIATTGLLNDKLMVYLHTTSGSRYQSNFDFVMHKL